MFLNKINLFLAISICLIFSFLIYNDVKSEEAKKISGIAKVTDGDTIKIDEKKIFFDEIQKLDFDFKHLKAA